MPSEKAKENKTLVAECAGCAKKVSVELLQGVAIRVGRRQSTVAVCDDCRKKGWKP